MLANAEEKTALEAAVAEEQAKVDAAAAAVKTAEGALAAAKAEATKTERAELAAYYLALHGVHYADAAVVEAGKAVRAKEAAGANIRLCPVKSTY